MSCRRRGLKPGAAHVAYCSAARLRVYLRRQLDETQPFLEFRRMKRHAQRFPLAAVLKPHLEPAIFDVSLGGSLGSTIIVLYFNMPSLQARCTFDRVTTFSANEAGVACTRFG